MKRSCSLDAFFWRRSFSEQVSFSGGSGGGERVFIEPKGFTGLSEVGLRFTLLNSIRGPYRIPWWRRIFRCLATRR